MAGMQRRAAAARASAAAGSAARRLAHAPRHAPASAHTVQVSQGGAEPLSPGCKELVLAAAPHDARAVFDSSMSLEAATSRVAQVGGGAGGRGAGRGGMGGWGWGCVGGEGCAEVQQGCSAVGPLPACPACGPALGPALNCRPIPCLQIAHAAGLSGSAGSPAGRGSGAIMLTGWVAFAAVCALVAVVLGMLGFAAWRYFGAPGPQRHRYTAVMKEGDV